MADPKAASNPDEYIERLAEPRRTEIKQLHDLVREAVPDLEPFMLGGMIGYGPYHYRYASGREGDWAIVALASQKNYISLYVCAGSDAGYVAEGYKDRLPKANIGRSCVRIKRLEDVDPGVVRALVEDGARAMSEHLPRRHA